MQSPTLRRKEKMYKAYTEFFDLAEKNRRWHPEDDIAWDWLDNPENSAAIKNGEGVASDEQAAICLETFCAVELFIPDYTMTGLNMARDFFGQAWFHLAWGYEESKHALSFRKYLTESGLRTEQEYIDFEAKVLEKVWTKPFDTYRQMACYGALQEIATYLIYQAQKKRYSDDSNPVLHQIFNLISRDEAAHTSLYRKFLDFEFEEDREGTEEDLAFVISHFEMPGVSLVPGYEDRIGVSGVGISPAEFIELGIMPTLKRYGMNRRTMAKALNRYKTKRMSTAEFKQHQEAMADLQIA
ncbi:MAG: acyl-ACP desaturase [Cellvibrionales bacterium]|nr:acyl-ACP desaturase [Cellvibrionales bacterium]